MSTAGHMVRMDCPNLDETRSAPLPPGFSLRFYEPGDEEAWVDIHREADTFNTFSLDTFWGQFGTDRNLLRKRQVYLLDGQDHAIGTASAWFQPGDPGLGRIHWVAIVPAYQGQGLAKPLLSCVCDRLRTLGHTRVYLTTNTVRVPAICLYFSFGFLPNLDGTARQQDWQDFLARTAAEPRAASIRAFLEA